MRLQGFVPTAAGEGTAPTSPVVGGALASLHSGQGRGVFQDGNNASPRAEEALPSKFSDFVGPPGQQGAVGGHGRDGRQGPAGPPGPQGGVLIGRPGPAGTMGTHGDRGPTGARGQVGLKGEPGGSFDAEAQGEGYLGEAKDLLQRADGLAQAHDQTSSILLMQLNMMEKQLGWDVKGAQHGDGVLASVAAQSEKLGQEVQEYRHRVMLAKQASADKELSQKSAADAVEQVEVQYKALTLTTEPPEKVQELSVTLRSSTGRRPASLIVAWALALALPAALLEK